MPKLHSKRDVLNGRGQLIAYERDPSTFYYRELVQGERRYLSKKIEGAATEEEALAKVVDIFAELRRTSEPSEARNGSETHARQPAQSRGTRFKKVLLEDCIASFIAEEEAKARGGELAPRSVDTTSRKLKNGLLEYLKHKNIIYNTQIDKNTFKSYAEFRFSNGLKTKLSMNTDIQAIKKWLNAYMVPNNLIDANLVASKGFLEKIRVKHEDLLANPAINPDDWEAIIRFIRTDWINETKNFENKSGFYARTMFWNFCLVMKNCGARPEELVKLKWKHIEYEDVGRTNSKGEAVSKEIAHILLRSSKTGELRTSSCNSVYVLERWKEFVTEYHQIRNKDFKISPNDYVWAKAESNGSSPYTYGYYQIMWRDIRNRLKDKLKGHLFSDHPYTIYSMRSTYIEDQLLAGKDIFLIARSAGHSVAVLQKHYERIDTRRRARELTDFQYGAKKKPARRSPLD